MKKLMDVINGDVITHYLLGMYIFKKADNNMLESYAYFKNYFDRVTAQLAYALGYDNNGKRPNYNRFFREVELIKFYNSLKAEDVENIIEAAHKLRNSNPVSHASAELVMSETSSKDIQESIDALQKLIKHACEDIKD